jgi:hypothetical protein
VTFSVPAAEHAFHARHTTVIRADINRAERFTGIGLETDNPDWISAFIVAQSVISGGKHGVRSFGRVPCHGVGAARIEIEALRVDDRAAGWANGGAHRRTLGRDAAIFHFNFTNPAARTRIVDENLPNLRLRIAVHAGNGNDTIDIIAL